MAQKAKRLIELFDDWESTIEVHTPRRKNTIDRMREFLDSSDVHSPALIMYLGNGTRSGWQVTETEEVLYSDLVRVLKEYPETRRISIVNDAPYGQMLMKELIGVRDARYTSCMCNSQFGREAIGEIFALALECWSEGLRPEQKIAALAPGDLGARHTLPVWQRW